MPRKPSDGADRQSINVRARAELKQRLEQIAAENGRSLAQEVDRRLEQSLEDPAQPAADPLLGVFSDEVRGALRGSSALAQLVEAIADTLLQTIRAAKERDRDEIEVRTAARAALNAVADQFLWRGESTATPIEGPLAPLGTRTLDYPPGALGWAIAQQRLQWLGTWWDDGAAIDTVEGRICDRYSGTGRVVILGPSAEEVEARRQSVRVAARAAAARGDAPSEAPENIHKYKPMPEMPPVSSDREPPPQSLKDIMGR